MSPGHIRLSLAMVFRSVKKYNLVGVLCVCGFVCCFFLFHFALVFFCKEIQPLVSEMLLHLIKFFSCVAERLRSRLGQKPKIKNCNI